MITREQSKNMFVFIKHGQDEFIKVDKRLYFKFIDLVYDGFEEREIFLSTKDVLCNDCKYYLSDNGNFPLDPCCECTRFYADKFESSNNETNSN